jgi:hypothetical protein
MNNWLKGAAVAGLLILPGCTSERATPLAVVALLISVVIATCLYWKDTNWKVREINRRDDEIKYQKILIEQLEEARINAQIDCDEGHVSQLTDEIAGAQNAILGFIREKRELEFGLLPGRNSW